ncbi:MAG: tRNA (adenosine(37)-N6)-threonylcarbamoyltransferase complex ATPase subunit type 1 TsaE [Gammaproteobacteria bacterium]|nr:tRNA (adenosine(37)-N6)-threonylcarbamoyltransferase complex ATPase subunit type 1 TsaE [Gammaproteobacteria bacterium]MDH5591528.1 tRNA (adenosine(37)-N6)-threonylcarbamoyltransferase complex ATPase subunit type 1 TsaE [Gammaproteobacteria bacterium]
MNIHLANEIATLRLGEQIAQLCPPQQFTIHLEGELGAGKTTLTRGFLHQLGHQGNVKSPTYTLVERYDLSDRTVFHFDLYRLTDPEELDFLGLDDYLSQNSICLIEWASQGGEYLPQPDISITLSYQNNGRQAIISALSNEGKQLCEQLHK